MQTSITLPSSNADIPIKLLGLCGSDQAGEHAAAALKADQLVRGCGLVWANVIHAPIQPNTFELPPNDWRQMRSFLLDHLYLLRDRELDFVEGFLSWRGRLTDRQHKWLIAIFACVKSEVAS